MRADPRRAKIALAVGLIVSAALAGCGSRAPHPQATTVVASTSVWGSVAHAVAGDHFKVRAILTDPAADPHSFQASPSDAAALIDAALVVYNGGGYDPWVDKVLADRRGVRSVNAYSFLGASSGPDGRARGSEPANEHVFYDLNVAKSVATAIADQLSAIDSGNAAQYRDNAAAFGRSADAIAASEHAIASAHPGASVIATESVAHYLLVAAGVTDRTPTAFAAATENETDASPADMAAVLDLINRRQVAAVLINPQTSTAATTGVQDAARRAGLPIIEVTETLPSGTDYLTWQRDTAGRLAAALASS